MHAFWPLLVVLPTVTLSAEFRRAPTGTEVQSIELPAAEGSRTVPARSGWQLVVTVSPTARKSDAVCRDMEKLVERVSPEHWSLLLIVTQAEPGSELPFGLPDGQAVAFDPERAWYEHLGLFVFPATALFDADGILRWQRSGHSRDWLDVAEDTLRNVLGLPAVPRGVAAGPTPSRDAERNYRMGVALRQEGRLDDARASLDSALALDPSFGKALLERGELSRDQGQTDLAAHDYRAALDSDSSLYRAWVGLGHLALGAQRLDDALTAAESALGFNSRSGDALALKARTLLGLERFVEAEEILQRLLLMSPGKADTHYYLGLIYEKTNRQGEALASYREALQLLLKDNSD